MICNRNAVAPFDWVTHEIAQRKKENKNGIQTVQKADRAGQDRWPCGQLDVYFAVGRLTEADYRELMAELGTEDKEA